MYYESEPDHFIVTTEACNTDPQKTIGYFDRRCGQILQLAIKWAPIETKAILEVSVGNLHNGLRNEEHLNLILDSHTVPHFTFLIIDYPKLVPRPSRPRNKVIISQTKE